MKTIADHIEVTPGTCGGKPRIAGHSIRVQDIVALHEIRGLGADEIVAAYAQLSLAQVHAALAYYYDNLVEMNAEMRADEAFIEQMRQKEQAGLRATNAGADAAASVTIIDVRDLPESMAAVVAETADHLRAQLKKRRSGSGPQQPPIIWTLGAQGRLGREEIYEHLDQPC